MTNSAMPTVVEQLDEVFKLRQEVLSQCLTDRFPNGWKLELLENENGESLKATWYFPPGYGYAGRGVQIKHDPRLPATVEVTLDGEAKTMPIQHFRSKAH